MNLSALQFSLAAVALTVVLLFLLDLSSGAPGVVYLAFLPAVLWAAVLYVKASR